MAYSTLANDPEVTEFKKSDLNEWKMNTKRNQNDYHQLLGNRKYDTFASADAQLLKKKLAFAMFGPPTSSELGSKEVLGYDKLSVDKVKSVFKVLKKISSGKTVYVSFVFVNCLTEDKEFYVPVFRISCCGDTSCECDSKVTYVDAVPRTYPDWQSYLNHNTLPKCKMGYPSTGAYWIPSSDVRGFQVAFRDSPANNIGNEVRHWVDVAATVVNVVAGLICFLALCTVPIAAPVAMAAICGSAVTGVICAGRSIETLHDRNQHGQSINITDVQARNCYMNILTGVVGAVAVGGVLKLNGLTKAGQKLTEGMQTVTEVITGSAVTVGGVKVVSDLANVVQRGVNGESMVVDVLSLAASAFFFCNMVLTASQISRVVGEMTAENQNTPERTASVLKAGAPVNNKIVFTPLTFCLNAVGTTISFRDFHTFLWDTVIFNSTGAIQLIWNNLVAVMEAYATLYLGKVGGTFAVSKLGFEDAMLLRSTLERVKQWIEEKIPEENFGVAYVEGYVEEFLEIHTAANKQHVCVNIRESISQMCFIQKYMQDACAEKISHYEAGFAVVQKFCKDVTRELYNTEHGIVDSYKEHFMSQTIKEFKTGKGFDRLCNAIEILATENLSVDDFVLEEGLHVLKLKEMEIEDRTSGKTRGNVMGISDQNIGYVIDSEKGTTSITFTDPNIGIREILIEGKINDDRGTVTGKISVKS